MALSSKDNPASTAAKAEPNPAPRLAKAGASGNAAVHNLLARRGCTEDAAQIAEIDAELAELGYEF